MLRLGLGIGEAVVSPASVSIISDYFARKERARAISLFMAGPYHGAGLAFLGGGLVVKWLNTLGPVHWPIVGALEPWHMTFLFVGARGFVFAALMLTIREPERREKLAPAQGFGKAFSRSEEHTSELQSLMRISYAVFCLKKKKTK